MSDYKFWCFVPGGQPFSVILSSGLSFEDVQRAIKNQLHNFLKEFDASDLLLWKADVEFNEATKAQFMTGQYQPDCSEGLAPWEKISEKWPEPPPQGHLHIFVTLRAAPDVQTVLGKRSRAANPKIPWLNEVHSKIWNRKDLKPSLFRKVEVTRAHYDKLQDTLNSKYPDRNLKEYDGRSHNVLSDKLDILKPITPTEDLSRRHPDNDEVRAGDNEVEDEINSLFPYTLRYLDLSTLKLRNKSDRFPSPILLRDEYDHISNLINSYYSRESMGSVIVSGQPGTGKTSYLYLRIIESLIGGRRFLYQSDEGYVYHVSENGVELIESPWESSTHYVAFVDADQGISEPNKILRNESVQIILASSPRGATQNWLNQGNFVKFIALATKLWSHHELFLTGIFLYPYDITFRLLRESVSYFGCNPRQCFDASMSVAELKSKMEKVEAQITNMARQSSDVLRELNSFRLGASALSHTIFELSPTANSRLESCQYSTVSRWAFDSLLKVCEDHEDGATARLYRMFSHLPWLGTLRGWLFEKQALKYLDTVEDTLNLSMRRLTDPKASGLTWTYHGPIPRLTFSSDQAAIDGLNNAVQAIKPLHLVPSTRNFPAVDSIVYEPGEVFTCIQVTVNAKHGINADGLKRIQRWLDPPTPAAILRPGARTPWRFVFIVPPDIEPTFKLQKFDKDSTTEVWSRKVDQYVLALDDETIFGTMNEQHNLGEQQMDVVQT